MKQLYVNGVYEKEDEGYLRIVLDQGKVFFYASKGCDPIAVSSLEGVRVLIGSLQGRVFWTSDDGRMTVAVIGPDEYLFSFGLEGRKETLFTKDESLVDNISQLVN